MDHVFEMLYNYSSYYSCAQTSLNRRTLKLENSLLVPLYAKPPLHNCYKIASKYSVTVPPEQSRPYPSHTWRGLPRYLPWGGNIRGFSTARLQGSKSGCQARNIFP